MIYLACPYTHESAFVQEYRFRSANLIAAELFRDGHHVFSPISHSHPIAEALGLPGDFKFWKEYCIKTLKMCDKVVVLKLEGWDKSCGVQHEIKLARELGMPVEYMEYEKTKN